jgi:hypothetical protein
MRSRKRKGVIDERERAMDLWLDEIGNLPEYSLKDVDLDKAHLAKKPPPTVAQLERIIELTDRLPEDRLDALEKRYERLIRTKGGAGILISWLKSQVPS